MTVKKFILKFPKMILRLFDVFIVVVALYFVGNVELLFESLGF
jgi:hypothetical protein